MIDLDEVIKIHEKLIEEFGGAQGLRNKGLLESALESPFQTFGGKELLPTPEEKAAALLENLVKNHPFVDGNKRIGYTVFRLFLMAHGKDIEAPEAEKYAFVIDIASGKLVFEEILTWAKNHLKDL